jgi:hypothetical protein
MLSIYFQIFIPTSLFEAAHDLRRKVVLCKSLAFTPNWISTSFLYLGVYLDSSKELSR